MKILIQLLKEIPGDTIVAKYISSQYTASEMLVLAEKKDPVAQQFFSYLLRVCRDILIRSKISLVNQILELTKDLLADLDSEQDVIGLTTRNRHQHLKELVASYETNDHKG